MSKTKNTHKNSRGARSKSDRVRSSAGKSDRAGKQPAAGRPGEENIAGVFRAKAKAPATLAATVAADAETHDAWTTDRLMRRSTQPPPGKVAAKQFKSKPPAQDGSGNEPISWLSRIPSEPSVGKALDLVERSSTEEQYFEPADEMEELFSLGNFSDALRIAELILGYQPDNEQAQRCAQKSRCQLEQLYSSKIGPLNQVPVVALRSSDLRWLGLDHRAGFVLSRIDGRSTIEDLFEICSMPRLEVLKTLIELLNCGAVFLEKASFHEK